MSTSESGVKEFYEYAERCSAEFRAQYGLTLGDLISDEMLGQMLVDYGYPKLADLPPGPRGMMVAQPNGGDPSGAMRRQQWRRTNAGHLLGHAILKHAEPRCNGCRDWGNADSSAQQTENGAC
jgi:hypothetical protein